MPLKEKTVNRFRIKTSRYSLQKDGWNTTEKDISIDLGLNFGEIERDAYRSNSYKTRLSCSRSKSGYRQSAVDIE